MNLNTINEDYYSNEIHLDKDIIKELEKKSYKNNTSLELEIIILLSKNLGGKEKIKEIIGKNGEKEIPYQKQIKINKNNIKCSNNIKKLIEEYKRLSIKNQTKKIAKDLENSLNNINHTNEIVIKSNFLQYICPSLKEGSWEKNFYYNPITGLQYSRELPKIKNIENIVNYKIKELSYKYLNKKLKGELHFYYNIKENKYYINCDNNEDTNIIKNLIKYIDQLKENTTKIKNTIKINFNKYKKNLQEINKYQKIEFIIKEPKKNTRLDIYLEELLIYIKNIDSNKNIIIKNKLKNLSKGSILNFFLSRDKHNDIKDRIKGKNIKEI